MKKFSIHIILRNRRIVRAFLRANTDLERSTIRRMSYRSLMYTYEPLLFVYNMSRLYFGRKYFFNLYFFNLKKHHRQKK